MSHTNTDPAVSEVTHPRNILARSAQFTLVFSLVFTGLLGFSRVFLFPQLDSLTLQGKEVSLRDIASYEKSLKAQLVAAESKRMDIVLPIHDDAYDALKMQKACLPSLQELEEQIRGAAAVVEGDPNVFVFSALRLDQVAGTLTVEGDIRNASTRSMTVLALFIEQLRKLPIVSSLNPPVFSRSEDKVIGFHSPFTTTLTLASSCSL